MKEQFETKKETLFSGLLRRVFQLLARVVPGATTWRVRLHRWRGVRIGKNVWIGYDSIIETGFPHLVSIGDGSSIETRVTIIAHYEGSLGVTIGKNVSIGTGAIILPNVKIGDEAVVAAGSVVTRSVPPRTMVQGNPAKPIAKIGLPLLRKDVTLKQFALHLKPIGKPQK